MHGVWPEFSSLRILVITIFAFLCVLCVSNDPVTTGEWAVNKKMVCLIKHIVHSLRHAKLQILTAIQEISS